MRRVLNVHYTTHSRYLPLIINKPDISTELMCRFNTFWSSCVYSPNICVNFVSRMVNSSQSVVSDNIKVLLSYLNKEYNEYASLLNNKAGVKGLMMTKYRNMCDIDDMCACTAIDELIKHRDGPIELPLTKEEGEHLLINICTS